MRWFHTIVLPLVTMLAVFMSVKRGSPSWKIAALIAGCASMLAGLWIDAAWSTIVIIGGCVLFSVALPRRVSPAAQSDAR